MISLKMISNPFQNRDLNSILRFPTISWSSYNAFENYDKEDWYQNYVLGNKSEPSNAMLFGQFIGEKLAINPDFLPEVSRPAIYEQELHAKLDKIMLVGHLDGLTFEPKCELLEYKTSTNPNKWNQEAVNNWGQLTFYALLLYLNFKIKPEDIKMSLTAIIGQEEEDSFEITLPKEPIIKTFQTSRNLKDILVFGAELKVIHKKMTRFVASKEDLR